MPRGAGRSAAAYTLSVARRQRIACASLGEHPDRNHLHRQPDAERSILLFVQEDKGKANHGIGGVVAIKICDGTIFRLIRLCLHGLPKFVSRVHVQLSTGIAEGQLLHRS